VLVLYIFLVSQDGLLVNIVGYALLLDSFNSVYPLTREKNFKNELSKDTTK